MPAAAPLQVLLQSNLDYLLFAAVALAFGLALQTWLHRHEGVRLPMSVWANATLILAIGAFLAVDAGSHARDRMAERVQGYAPTYASELERLGHTELGLHTRADDPRYLQAVDAEKRWLHANPGVNDIYTMRRDATGHVRFVVDSETDYDHDGRFRGEREQRTPIGEIFESDSTALGRAFAGRGGFEAEPYEDRWGTWVSAFWPLHDRFGRVDAVLGIDYAAQDWLAAIAEARHGVMWVVAVVLLALFGASMMVALLRAQLVQREQTAAALRAAKDAAESANALKSQFLANMSHEIRTPIHGIMGLTELLLRTPLSEKQQRWASLVQGSVHGLLAVVNNILDYSKIEADRLLIERIPFDLPQLLRDVVDLHASAAQEKGLRLALSVDPALPAALEGDPTRLRQILNNLLNNAVKFTAEGTVSVRVLRGAGGRVRFEVLDSGPGIPEQSVPSLFQPFIQADGSTTRRYGGTGLGLAISKRLVELMRGEIGVAAPDGGGACFWAELPLPEATMPGAGTGAGTSARTDASAGAHAGAPPPNEPALARGTAAAMPGAADAPPPDDAALAHAPRARSGSAR